MKYLQNILQNKAKNPSQYVTEHIIILRQKKINTSIIIGTNTVKYFQEIDDVSHLPRRSAQLRMGGVTLTLIT